MNETGDFYSMNYKKIALTRIGILIIGGLFFIGTHSSAMQGGVSLSNQEPISFDSNAKTKPMAPNFELKTIEGDLVRLTDYRGKVVVLNFWATWCPPCRKEIPDFIELTDSEHSDEFMILGVTLQSGTRQEIQMFAEKQGMNYPVLTGDAKYLMKLTQLYGGVRGIPTTFIIDGDGKVQDKYVGAKSADEVWKLIQAAM